MNIQIKKFYDCLSSYGYWSRTDDVIKEDEKGKYKEKYITKEVPCNCHPETCCHIEGKKNISYVKKVYITTRY